MPITVQCECKCPPGGNAYNGILRLPLPGIKPIGIQLPTIHLCPDFFTNRIKQQQIAMHLHEVAHVTTNGGVVDIGYWDDKKNQYVTLKDGKPIALSSEQLIQNGTTYARLLPFWDARDAGKS
jgi:hypothetical protein